MQVSDVQLSLAATAIRNVLKSLSPQCLGNIWPYAVRKLATILEFLATVLRHNLPQHESAIRYRGKP